MTCFPSITNPVFKSGGPAEQRKSPPFLAKTLLITAVVCALLAVIGWTTSLFSGSLTGAWFVAGGCLFLAGILAIALSGPRSVKTEGKSEYLSKRSSESINGAEEFSPKRTPIRPKRIEQKSPPLKEHRKENYLLEDQCFRLDKVDRSLTQWVNQSHPSRTMSGCVAEDGSRELKNRKKAKAAILECFNQKNPHLSLPRKTLGSLPPILFEFDWLTSLSLRMTGLKEVPLELKKLPLLESLDLSGNFITHLPRELFECKQLSHLNLGLNEITSISGKIDKCKKMQTLDLSGNRLKKLPKGIGELASLEELTVFSNEIQHLPTELAKCRKLRLLYVWGNSIIKVPNEIASIPGIQIDPKNQENSFEEVD